jgi:hypothetical protein
MNADDMTREELLAELTEQRQRYLDLMDALRLTRDQLYRTRDRADALLVEMRKLAKGEAMPSLMVKVRAFETDAENTRRLPKVHYFGPSHSHDARRTARRLRSSGKRVEVLVATMGRWHEVDW